MKISPSSPQTLNSPVPVAANAIHGVFSPLVRVAVLALSLVFAAVAPDALAQAPVVTSVTIVDDPGPGDGRIYAACDIIEVDVLFDQRLGVTGRPRLTLDIGVKTVQAKFSRVSGEASGGTVRFEYGVRAGDRDDDGISIGANAVNLNGGTIQNRDRVNANTALGSHAITNDGNYKVDARTDICQVAITSSPAAGGIYRVGETIVVQVRVNRVVTVNTKNGTPRVALTFGTGTQTQTRYARFAHASAVHHRNTDLTFRYTVAPGDRDPDGVAIPANAVDPNGGRFFLTRISRPDNEVTFTLDHAAVPAASGQKVDAPALTVPLAPDLSGVTVAVSGQTLSFRWTSQAAYPARAAVTGYRVERSADGSTGWTAIAPNLGAPAMPGTAQVVFTEQNVRPSTTRHYRVFALSALGDSQPSATVSGTVPAAANAGTQTGGGGGGGSGGGGGGDRDRPTGTTAQVTPGTATAGTIGRRGETDTFVIAVPTAGLLRVRTTGPTNTVGTLTGPGVEPLRDDDGGAGTNFRIVTPVDAGTYRVTVQGSGTTTGAYTFEATLVVSVFENPRPGSFQSGLGVISGWVCEADGMEIEIETADGAVHRLPAAYGTSRADTAVRCGEGTTDTGFGLLVNWNLLGDGEHTVRALVDDIAFGTAIVTVTTLGGHEDEEFRRGLHGETIVTDFPTAGEEPVRLVWQESLQNFVLAPPDGELPPAPPAPSDGPQGVLENPAPASYQSGLGVISGWVCEAEVVEIELTAADGQVSRAEAAYGTSRADTASDCGHSATGFGLLFNWNLLGDGEHTVRVLADGVEFGRATVVVTTLGEEIVEGAEGRAEVADFPAAGRSVTVEWQAANQNFVLTGVE